MKSSPLIWRYVLIVKLTVKILSICVAFFENMNLEDLGCTNNNFNLQESGLKNTFTFFKAYMLENGSHLRLQPTL